MCNNNMDDVAMVPKNKNYDEDFYADKVHRLISNLNLAKEEEEDVDDDYCEPSFNTSQSQDLEIERNVYWQSQQSLLQEILDHHGSTGLKMKQEIARIIEIARETSECVCLSRKSSGCCKCLRQRVINILCSKGFYATLSASNWRHTSKLPGAKRSAWEKRIHIGPWRKRSFMLKKWSASGLFEQPFSSNNALEMFSKPSSREVNMPLICHYIQFSSSVSSVKVI